jgi:hypothetical protein
MVYFKAADHTHAKTRGRQIVYCKVNVDFRRAWMCAEDVVAAASTYGSLLSIRGAVVEQG